MNAPLYTIDILRLAAGIPHVGRLADAAGASDRRSRTCGSRVRVEVRLDSEGRVAALGQMIEACAFGQAAAALMGRHAIGRTLAEVEAAQRELADWLGGGRDQAPAWPGLAALQPARARPARHGAMLLPFTALGEAMRAAGA